ncbi:hypothetical protein MTO96_038617 [Rhipicephalus appendiculatus]
MGITIPLALRGRKKHGTLPFWISAQCTPKTPCMLRRKARAPIKMLLMFWDRDHHCGLFKAEGLTRRTECEIHAWNSAMLQYKTRITQFLSCEERFYNYCNKTEYTQKVYYSESCRTQK